MSDTRPKGRRRRAKKSVVLVFGEAGTDRRALAELVKALCPDAPNCKPLRRPLVLVKDRERAAQRKNAVDIASQVYVEQEELEVTLVIAHQDCDACEPADQALALDIEQHLGDLGCPAVAAAPAWEMEAWWYQWPDALLAINRRWRHPNRKGTEIGRVRNAKEQLRRDRSSATRSEEDA